MRILLASQRFRPLIGGAESVLWALAREFVRLGHDTTALTARWQKVWPAEECVEGVAIVRLPLPRVRFWGTWRYVQSVKRWLRQNSKRFDVCYVSMLKHTAWACLTARRGDDCPVVLRPEGAGPTGDIAWQKGALGGRLIRSRCLEATAIVSLSPAIREELQEDGYRGERICEIGNGVPIPELSANDRHAWRERLALDSAGPIAVFVGRLSPEKGLPDLVTGWSRVQRQVSGSRLVIVGEGPQEAELRRLADTTHGIVWAGATSDPQVYLRAADLFVLPSYEEGMSIALLEAMSFGLPVVGTDIPGNRGVIESGRHGLLVPPRRPDLLAGAMVTLLQARTLAAAMGRAARERVAEEFSITRMAERHIELFESLRRKE